MLLLLGLGCRVPSVMVAQTVGPVMPVDDGAASGPGFAVQTVAGVDDGGAHVHFHRAGGTQELAFGLDVFHVASLGTQGAAYVRLGVNLIEWDRVDTDDGAGVLGPTFEIGVSRAPVCVSLSASRDFRFNDPDDTFLGVNVGMCNVAPAHKYDPVRRYGIARR